MTQGPRVLGLLAHRCRVPHTAYGAPRWLQGPTWRGGLSRACHTGPPSGGGAGQRRIFSGIQPTGVLHLGNYFGAVRQWVALQEGGEDVVVSVVDLHSITLPQDPKALHTQILTMAASLLACGLDPQRVVLFQQSRVLEHAQLMWVLGCLSTMARLHHLPQYKEKSAAVKEVGLGLLVYPVLQAADILLYGATHVPVGQDQLQHIQLAQHLARVFNNRYGATFATPHALTYQDDTARLKSLRNPLAKMSKSEADHRSRIELTDTDAAIAAKVRKAVTDCTSEVYYDPEGRPGVANLMALHRAVTGLSIQDIEAEARGLDTGQYKGVVADVVVAHVAPIRDQLTRLMQDKGHLMATLDHGADKARAIAAKTWATVQTKVGLAP